MNCQLKQHSSVNKTCENSGETSHTYCESLCSKKETVKRYTNLGEVLACDLCGVCGAAPRALEAGLALEVADV
jgi:hypothetical protein